jgi:hypothetical protein
MGKASWHISDFNSDVSDDSSPEGLFLRVVELKNAICNQDKLLGKVFHENKKVESWAWEFFFLKLLLFNPRMMIWVPRHMITTIWSWLTMWICGSYTLVLQVCLMVLGWNSESSKLVPRCSVLVLVILCLDLICRLLPLRLKILNINLINLLATLFYSLLVKHVSILRVSFFMLSKRT